MSAYANKVESAVISAVPGTFRGAILTAGSDAATVTLYDNASAGSGTIIAKLAAPAANTSVVFIPPDALQVYNGIYAALTGTAPSATVLYTP